MTLYLGNNVVVVVYIYKILPHPFLDFGTIRTGPQLRNLPTFLPAPHTKGLMRIVVASLTNPSKTPATLNNYLWCINYSR